MATSKKYFQDHFVLLLLSINVFLAVAGIIFILIRISTSHGNSYIVQYRPTLGIGAYEPGSVTRIFSFTVFLMLVAITNVALSYKVYKIHRQLAISILSLGILLLILPSIISNALLLLR